MFWLEILVRNLALHRSQPFDLQAFFDFHRETQLVHRVLQAGGGTVPTDNGWHFGMTMHSETVRSIKAKIAVRRSGFTSETAPRRKKARWPQGPSGLCVMDRSA